MTSHRHRWLIHSFKCVISFLYWWSARLWKTLLNGPPCYYLGLICSPPEAWHSSFPPGLKMFGGGGKEEVVEGGGGTHTHFNEHVALSCQVLVTSVSLLSATVSLCLPYDSKGECRKQQLLFCSEVMSSKSVWWFQVMVIWEKEWWGRWGGGWLVRISVLSIARKDKEEIGAKEGNPLVNSE